jgi:hypothetical protein
MTNIIQTYRQKSMQNEFTRNTGRERCVSPYQICPANLIDFSFGTVGSYKARPISWMSTTRKVTPQNLNTESD